MASSVEQRAQRVGMLWRARPFALLPVACVLVALTMPVVSSATSATELKSQLDSLKQETSAAGNAFDQAYWRLDETEVRIAKTDKKIARATKQLARAQTVLDRHAAASYRRGPIGLVEFLVGASSFEEFIDRAEFLRRVGESDAQVITDVIALKRQLVAHRAELAKQRRVSVQAVAELKGQRDRLEEQLKSKQAQFLKVKAALDAMRGGPNRPDGQLGVPGPNGMVFPVRGSYYYSDTWGASRSGGRRTHQGTDIMAPRGTPVVACLSGSVNARSGGLGGNAIWEVADNGWQFYYAHLDGFAVRSGHVSAGQVIGYVGNTGNAAGGACHLHFQIEPHGYPVNPYPYLRAME